MKKLITLIILASLAFTIQAQDITNKLSATGDFKVNKSDDANIMTIKADGKVGIGTDTPKSTLDVGGTLSLPIVVTIGSTYTMGDSDYTLVGASGTLTVTLPEVTAAIHGRVYVIKRRADAVTINPFTGQAIDALTTFTLDAADEFVVIQAVFQAAAPTTATWVAIGGKY